MKNIRIFSLFIGLMVACSPADPTPVKESIQFTSKLQLVEMTGGIPNSSLSGAAMEWQETIQFTDGQFEKTRVRSGKTTSASGKYSYELASGNELVLKLLYDTKSELVGSCYGDSTELYSVWTDEVHNTWNECDGPGLIYRWVK